MQSANIVKPRLLPVRSQLSCWGLWLLICWSPPVQTQADTPVRSRAVDVVLLTDGTRLFGVAESDDPKAELCLVVRGDWLREEHPDIVARLKEIHSDEHADKDDDASVRLLEEQVEVLTKLDERPIERIGFLREQIRRLEKQADAPPPFYMIQLNDAQVRRRHHQARQRRELSILGLLNNVADMETMSATELGRQLWEIPASQLHRELPMAAQASSLSVGQRILIRTERLFGRVARFASTGNRYFANDGPDQNIGEMAIQMLSDQMTGQLKDVLSSGPANVTSDSSSSTSPLPGARLPVGVVDRVRRYDADIVEISSAFLQPGVGATVRVDTYHRTTDADWVLRVIGTGRAGMAEVAAGRVRQIADDPRVQQIADLGRQLGINRQLTQAVSMGAAVEIALTRAQDHVRQQLTRVDSNAAIPRKYRLLSEAAAADK